MGTALGGDDMGDDSLVLLDPCLCYHLLDQKLLAAASVCPRTGGLLCSLACLDTACKNGLQLRSEPSLDTPFPHNTFSTLRAKLYCNQDGDLEEMLLLFNNESLYYNRNIRGNWLRL